MNKETLNFKIVQNIIRLCTERNEHPTNACMAAGVGKSFISDMRRGRSPSILNIVNMAEYLNVTVSDLVGDAKEMLPAQEQEALGKEFAFFIQNLSPDQREALAAAMDNKKKEG